MRRIVTLVFIVTSILLTNVSNLHGTDLLGDELILLKQAGFSETFIGKVIESPELKITIDEMVKMKSAGIEESTILKMTIQTQSDGSEIWDTHDKPKSAEEVKLLKGEYSVKHLYAKRIDFFPRAELGNPEGKIKNVKLKYDESGKSDHILLEFILNRESHSYTIDKNMQATVATNPPSFFIEAEIEAPFVYWEKQSSINSETIAFVGFVGDDSKRKTAFRFPRLAASSKTQFATSPSGSALLVLTGAGDRYIIGPKKTRLFGGPEAMDFNPDGLHHRFRYSAVWTTDGKHIYIADRHIGKDEELIFAKITLGLDESR